MGGPRPWAIAGIHSAGKGCRASQRRRTGRGNFRTIGIPLVTGVQDFLVRADRRHRKPVRRVAIRGRRVRELRLRCSGTPGARHRSNRQVAIPIRLVFQVTVAVVSELAARCRSGGGLQVVNLLHLRCALKGGKKGTAPAGRGVVHDTAAPSLSLWE